MKPFMTIKEASKELGLPVSTIRNLCRMEACKRAVHKFDDGITAPIYLDVEMLLTIIRAGKADS